MASTRSSEQTLTPHLIVIGYSDLYQKIYSHEAQVLYVGNSWYRVNGELVHRSALLSEIDRLRDMANISQPDRHQEKRSMVQRLIAKLRGA